MALRLVSAELRCVPIGPGHGRDRGGRVEVSSELGNPAAAEPA
ncbi:hypothetical protein [Nonomuraea turcica]|nr:hypothetical protein [Nonomuraea sp. G32]MDP4510467.1 hypothetical protein [Nonomuraea sp. G32]